MSKFIHNAVIFFRKNRAVCCLASPWQKDMKGLASPCPVYVGRLVYTSGEHGVGLDPLLTVKPRTVIGGKRGSQSNFRWIPGGCVSGQLTITTHVHFSC